MPWKRKGEKGSASIEACISFVFYIFVITTIYAVLSYSIVQQRINYAVDSAARTVADYSYFYSVFGLNKAESEIDKSAEDAANAFNTLNEQIPALGGSVSALHQGIESGDTNEIVQAVKSGSKSSKEIYDLIKNTAKDPGAMLVSLFAYAMDGASDYAKSEFILQPIAKLFIMKQFGDTEAEANEYLKTIGVKGGLDGIELKDSKLFSDDKHQDIEIVATYSVDFEAFGLIKNEFKIKHVAKVRGWLGGDSQ